MIEKSVKKLDEKILKMLKSPKLKTFYTDIVKDNEVRVLTKMANNVTIGRLGLNDHGPVHSKIVTLNALKILELLLKAKIKPTVVKEKWGDMEDAKAAVILSAYIHDIGCTVSRKDHDKIGTTLGEPLARRLLETYDAKKAAKLLPFVLEGILCHLGNYPSTSVEAGLVSVADGTDITKGRSRIPFEIGKRDIHEYSTRAIDEVKILKGKEKPVKIEVKMNSSAGVFQVEKILLEKLQASSLKEHVEVVSTIKDGEKVFHDVEL